MIESLKADKIYPDMIFQNMSFQLNTVHSLIRGPFSIYKQNVK